MTISVRISPADRDAYFADLLAIYERYGFEDDCAPHLRKERDAAVARATAIFCECIDLVPNGGSNG